MGLRRQLAKIWKIVFQRGWPSLLLAGIVATSSLVVACGTTGTEISARIGPSGGVVEVTEPSHPLYGVRVEIPKGALTKGTLIEINEDSNPPPLSAEMTPVSPIIRFSPDRIRFNSPVKITLSYNTARVDADDFVLPLAYSEKEDYWYAPYIADIDRATGTVEIRTAHFSHIIVSIIDKLTGWKNPPNYDTEFKPQVNGFPISNKNTAGWCGGMVSFAQWLYQNHRGCKGLYGLPPEMATRIANEAQSLTMEPNWWQEFLRGWAGRFFSWDDFLYWAKRGMAKNKSPLIIAKYTKGAPAPHAGLAYKYEGDIIWIYDPSYPGQERIFTVQEYDQPNSTYVILPADEVYSSADFEQLFDKYKDELCPGKAWRFSFSPSLPAVHIVARPIEIHFREPSYDVPDRAEMDIDFGQMPQRAGLGQSLFAPLPMQESPLAIPITTSDGKIDGSVEFTHQLTGHKIRADLSGTIAGNSVAFNIEYYLPPGVQNYNMPLSFSDEMSDMEGRVYYSLPAKLAQVFKGTIVEKTEERQVIVGTFTLNVAGQFARWRYDDKEYEARIGPLGPVREDRLFEGVVEWTFSDLRLGGEFKVEIQE